MTLLQTSPERSVAYRVLRRARHSARSVAQTRQRQRVARLLRESDPPDVGPSDADFDRLQSIYPQRRPYGYDPRSVWSRAAERAEDLLALPGMDEPGKDILDAGAGEGMLGVLLNTFGHRTSLADMEDWRCDQAKGLPLLIADLDDPTTLPEASFDLVCSFNTLEHVTRPRATLDGFHRALRPGGLVYLDFGPLYCSPWGLHAYGTLNMPFPQFLFSEERISEALHRFGIFDLGGPRDTLQPLNRFRLEEFRELWNRDSQWTLIDETPVQQQEHLDLAETYPAAFRGRGLVIDDLVTSNLVVVLQKPLPTARVG